MANNDNTSVGAEVQTPEITNQETLEAAFNAEPVKAEVEQDKAAKKTPEVKQELEKKETGKIFGKYNSLEDAQEAYANIQARATRAEQALKELEARAATKTADELKAMDYDSQIQYLLGKVQDYDIFKAELASKMAESQQMSQAEQDKATIAEFVSKNPLLKETGLDEEFELIATHPSMQEYTLESIYNVKMKPKLEKLMGTKLSVKERKLTSTTQPPETNTFPDVSKMSAAEYEKHRAQILGSAGINGIR